MRPSQPFGRAAISITTLAGQGLLRVFMGMILASALESRGYGVFASGMALATLASVVWVSSSGAALTRYAGRAQGMKDYALAASVSTQVSIIAVAAAFATSAAATAVWLLWHGGGWASLAVFGLTFGTGLQLLARAANLLAGNYLREGLWGLSTTIVGCLGAVSAGLLTDNPYWALGFLAFGYVAYAWSSLPALTRRHRLPSGRRREIVTYTSVVSLGSVASAGFLQLGTVIAGAGWGTAAAGVYGLAAVLAMPVSLAASAGALLINPQLARHSGATDVVSGRLLWRNTTAIYGLLLLPLVTAIGLVGINAIASLLGDEFRDSGAIVVVLLVAVSVSGIATPSVAILTMHQVRDAYRTTLYSWGGALCGGICWVWAIAVDAPLVTVAWGYLLGVTVTATAAVFRAGRLLGNSWMFSVPFLMYLPLLLLL